MMKRISILTLTILLLLTTGCGTETVKYVIYYDASMGSPIRNNESASAAKSESPMEQITAKDFSYSNMTTVENPDAPASRTVTLAGQQYALEHQRSYNTPLSTADDAQLSSRGKFEKYRSGENDTIIEAVFRRDTDELLFFYNSNESHKYGQLSEDTAVQLADATLAEVFGAKIAAEYSRRVVIKPKNSSFSAYTVVYTKYICGYPTTDDIEITYNTKGNLMSINAKTLGVFDTIEDRITAKKIENAKNALLDSISDRYTLHSEFLALDADGNCYLQVYATYTEGGMAHSMLFYVNLD